MNFLIVHHLVSSIGGQWSEPWLVEPPNIDNSAYGHVKITGGNTINAEENIVAGSILAVLKFTGKTILTLSLHNHKQQDLVG